MAPTVIITGASEGIGKATAHRFARHGYNVVMAARHADRLNDAAEELRSLNHSALAVPTDVKDFEQVNSLVQKALNEYGSIDVLINNVGIYASGPVEQFSLDDWHYIIDTNLWGYIHTIHAVLPHFIERKTGTIVNLSSIGGKVPIPYHVVYTTSKFAIAGLTQALHGELSHKGIHVCGIYPNLIASDFMKRAVFRGNTNEDTEARRHQVQQITELPIVEKPDDVAKAIWDAVKHQKTEVIVGSAKLSAGSNHLFPQLTQELTKKVFQHQD